MRKLGRIFLVSLAVIGAVTLLLTALVVTAVSVAIERGPGPLPTQTVISADLNHGLAEAAPDNPFSKLQLEKMYVLRDLVDTLERGAADPKVTGFVASLGAVPHLDMAKAQELRDAVLAFRKAGKTATAFADSFGETGHGTVDYYLASAFDTVWLQPSGDVAMTGFQAESLFVRDTLDWLGVKPQFGARYEYKTAIDTLTERGFTKEHRDSLAALIGSWFAQVAEGIGAGRKLPADTVRQLVDRAPLLAEDARAAGLVDRLGYWDELEAELKKGGAKIVDAEDYLRRAKAPAYKDSVALIYAGGVIQRGESKFDPLGDGAIMGADTVAEALSDAIDDDDIKAILLRVDSPGGSYVASDTMWREVMRAKEKKKPIVVSMGKVAASGGYMLSLAADRIIAEPGTITGSIGVFAGKMVIGDLLKKVGVATDEVHVGANAGLWSANHEFSPEGWRRLDVLLDRVYQDFTAKAMDGRKGKIVDIDKVARGRIWTGADALKVGLVDELGGVSTALAAAKKAAKIAADTPVKLVQFPKPKNLVEYLNDMVDSGKFSDAAALVTAATDLQRLLVTTRPLVQHLDSARAQGPSARMPLVELH